MPDWSEHIFRIKGLPLEVLKFRADYVTSAPVELPPFAGGIFRGLFGLFDIVSSWITVFERTQLDQSPIM
jgi:hypothetical protein